MVEYERKQNADRPRIQTLWISFLDNLPNNDDVLSAVGKIGPTYGIPLQGLIINLLRDLPTRDAVKIEVFLVEILRTEILVSFKKLKE